VKIFLVGGAVRDELMGKTPKDRDWVVVGGTTNEMLENGFQQVGKSFPVFLHPETKEEYALARVERKVGIGHTQFEFDASPSISLEQDLARRDLTINSIAKDSDGSIIDPFHGIADIHDRILRHTSGAFDEDPLRVVRTARFAATMPGFAVHGTTLARMRAITSRGELLSISGERIWMELEKVLKNPEAQVWRFFEVLYRSLADQYIFPEFHALFGVPQSTKHHPENTVQAHMGLVMSQIKKLTNDPVTIFGALCHDLGKGTTEKDKLPQHIDHESRGVPIAIELCRRIKTPKEYKQFACLASEKHLLFHKLLEMKPGKITQLLDDLHVKHSLKTLERFIHVCLADQRGRGGTAGAEGAIEAEYLLDCTKAYVGVEPRIANKDGEPYSGDQIKALLFQDRAEAIRSISR
jgi:tRNA nucleotidyltransferase (CCA-adding enzyme)